MARYAVGEAPLPSSVQVHIENAGKNITDFEIIRKADELIKQNKCNVASGRGLKSEFPLPGLSSLSGLNQYGWESQASKFGMTMDREKYWSSLYPQVSMEKFQPEGVFGGLGQSCETGMSWGSTYGMNPMCKL